MMREHSDWGPRPFSASLIESWARLMGVDPTPSEVRALARLSIISVSPPPEDD